MKHNNLKKPAAVLTALALAAALLDLGYEEDSAAMVDLLLPPAAPQQALPPPAK